MNTESSSQQLVDLGDIYYRTCRPNDVPSCLQIELASYPPDEAATETSLQYRQENATPYFMCAVISHPNKDPEDAIIGFICSTRCNTFSHESMTVHVPDGNILAIHSVVIAELYRRQGIATQMLQQYIQNIVQQQQQQQQVSYAPQINKIALLAKAHLLSFYVDCGFQVKGPSSITHGKERWYDLEMTLGEAYTLESSSTARKYFVVDAFADSIRKGTGNPAAIVPVESELTNVEWMQVVAQEMNLSETAFVWKIPQQCDEDTPNVTDDTVKTNHYRIRYFTPTVEVDICGHATLASAAILCNIHNTSSVVFYANHNVVLRATCNDIMNPHCAQISMTFPTQSIAEIQPSHNEHAAVKAMIRNAFPTIASDDIFYIGVVPGLSDLLVEVRHQAFFHHDDKSTNINIRAMMEWDGYDRGIILCCMGTGTEHNGESNTNGARFVENVDFCTRFFGPKVGIDEDPVTGSAHCALAPYFGKKLQKLKLVGRQLSLRGGIVHCELSEDGNHVTLSGTAVTTASGNLWM